MRITLRRTDALKTDFKQVRKLYNSAFPSDERAPMWLLEVKSRQKGVDLWSLYADGKWVGMAYAVNDKDLSYLFYFAISEEERGKGYGSAALRAILKRYEGRRLFLAMEPPDENADNYEQRIARRDFYLKNGLRPIPARIREAKVYYDAMGVGGEPRPGEYESMMRRYFGFPLCGMVAMEFDRNCST